MNPTCIPTFLEYKKTMTNVDKLLAKIKIKDAVLRANANMCG